MKIVFSKKCLEYKSEGHPESPYRISSTYEYLKEKGFSFVEPKKATKGDILLVHTERLFESVRDLTFFDPDTPAITKILDYALLSCGAAIKAMEIALEDGFSFSLMRPPGHHATRDSLGGFCYFNNIAVATKKALSLGKRVTILDIDCHHGNGTEDIFKGQEDVLYVSLHQVPLYPGTGLRSFKNCLNYPLEAGTGEDKYLAVLKEAFSDIVDFGTDILAISCGFDTFKDDPLTQMNLEIQSYGKISHLIKVLFKGPCFCVLEGGYSSLIKYCVYEFLKGWS